MKPGNLLIQGAKSVGKTRDEDSIERTSSPMCGFFYVRRKEFEKNGKKIVYF